MAPDGFDDQLGAVRSQPGDDVVFVGVDDDVGAERPGRLRLVPVARRDRHRGRTERPSRRRGEQSGDPGPEDGDPHPFDPPADGECAGAHGVHTAGERLGQGGDFGRDAGGNREHSGGGHHHPLGETPRRDLGSVPAEPVGTGLTRRTGQARTGQVGLDDHETPQSHACDVRADRGHGSCDLVAGGTRLWLVLSGDRQLGMAPGVEVRPADATGRDCDLDFTGSRRTERGLAHLERLGSREERSSHQNRKRGTGGFMEYSTTP